MKYFHRQIEKTVKKYLSIFPAVAVTGPRQSGKSTMLKTIFGNKYTYLTFDDPILIEQFSSDPKGFMNQYNNRIIFDEVQKVPELFHYLKMEIDSDRNNYGKFILTGSSQFAFIKSITETLAGRIGALTLLPFQRSEVPQKLRAKQILFGGYPELATGNYNKSRQWYSAYLRNYLERDVRSLANIGNMRDFQRLIFLLASRTAQELNFSRFARDIGVSVKTIQKWISVLAASYVIFLLPPYYKNLGKRITKRPKLYFYDTGLVCYLTGIRDSETLAKGPMQGEIFETYVISEVVKSICHNDRDAVLYYFRDNLGLEVDLIIEDNSKKTVSFIEIKNSQTIRPQMAKSILSFMKRRSPHRKLQGYLVYRGKEKLKMFDKITCLNYADFLA